MPDKNLTPDEIEMNLRMVSHLKKWFRFRRFTQERVAANIGVSEGTLSKWLQGKQAMSLSDFSRIAALMGVPEERLLAPPQEPGTLQPYVDAGNVIKALSPEKLARWLALGKDLIDPSGD